MISPIELARGLAPTIRDHADRIEADRELPRPLFDALADAGLYQLALPRSLGGSELDLPTYVRVMEVLGQADASTAWTVNQGGMFATYAAHMQHDAAHDIWVRTPRSVVANSPGPYAQAVAVEGGYRVTGRQGFSTGCRHASWVAAHAQIMAGGELRRLPTGQPETRYLLLPAIEATVEDTWHVRGMRGTGSHHFVVDDVFVPEERSVEVAASRPREPGPLYRIPRSAVFAAGDAAIAVGVGRASIEAFIALAGAKTPWGATGLLRDQQLVQADIGYAEARLRSGRALLIEAALEMWSAVEAGDPLDLDLDVRVSLRLAATHAIRLAAESVDAVYSAAGGTAIYEGARLQRYFQDIHVITQHPLATRSIYEVAGRSSFGLPVDETRL